LYCASWKQATDASAGPAVIRLPVSRLIVPVKLETIARPFSWIPVTFGRGVRHTGIEPLVRKLVETGGPTIDEQWARQREQGRDLFPVVPTVAGDFVVEGAYRA